MTNKAAPKVKLFEVNFSLSRSLGKLVIFNNYHIHFIAYAHIDALHIDGVKNLLTLETKDGQYRIKTIPTYTYITMRLLRKQGFLLVTGKLMVNLDNCAYFIHKDTRPTLYLKNQGQIWNIDLDIIYQQLRIENIRMVFKTKRKMVKKNVLIDAYDFKYNTQKGIFK